MEWFQQSDTEQHDKVNGHCKPKSPQDAADVRWTPPEGESGGSDSCGAMSVSELTDLQELKANESEDEEDKEETEGAVSKGSKGDPTKKEKQHLDGEDSSKQKAASSYTGEHWNESETHTERLLFTHVVSSSRVFSRRPVDHLVTLVVRTVASGSGGQHRVRDQRGVQSLRGQGVWLPLWRACM